MSQASNIITAHRFSVAPMIDCTDRHFRYLARLLSRKARLYTEMITSGALLHGKTDYMLAYAPQEHPLALQLGGSDPVDLASCARLGADYGYDEINLNVGCPSHKVQNHMIGACLMAHPQLVSDCMAAMQAAVDIPVTIKHRIGVDQCDHYDHLANFVDIVSATGCKTFIVHARSAILTGLSPKQNREVPPLQYEKVYALKRDFPALEIVINGGITSLLACRQHLNYIDGVMLGRAAYHNSYLLQGVDSQLYNGAKEYKSRMAVARNYLSYMGQQHSQGVPLHHMTRHLLGLFHALPGARLLRRHISENIYRPEATLQVIEDALAKLHVAPKV
jgi:tRNA-dihydrouridine synthase A